MPTTPTKKVTMNQMMGSLKGAIANIAHGCNRKRVTVSRRRPPRSAEGIIEFIRRIAISPVRNVPREIWGQPETAPQSIR